MGVYTAMVTWSLPRITAAAGGLVPFDLRPAGYSPDEARAFLGDLSSAGVAFYQSTQHFLDLIYPPLVAATLFFSIVKLVPENLGSVRWVLAATAVPSFPLDYIENALVSEMLVAGPAVESAIINQASLITVLKSAITTLAMTTVLLLLVARAIIWILRRLKRRGAGSHAENSSVEYQEQACPLDPVPLE
jgi:hypothetical protein